jgi:hypothetical protein
MINSQQDYYKWIGGVINEIRSANIPVFQMMTDDRGFEDVDEFVNSNDIYEAPWAWTTDRNAHYHLDCKIEKIEDGDVHLFETGEGWGERHTLEVAALPVETLMELYYDFLPRCLEKSE